MATRPWTIYPARALIDVPEKFRADFDAEFDSLKVALRSEGYKLYEFIGINPNATCEQITDWDLKCVEQADLVLGIHRFASSGLGGELLWKSASQGSLIVGAPRGVSVSRFIQGIGVRNPNFQFVVYDHILDLVPATGTLQPGVFHLNFQ